MAGLLKDGGFVTLAAYKLLKPRAQGFVQYWEGDQPGSGLKDETNPYPAGSADFVEWEEGQQLACQAAQDLEE